MTTSARNAPWDLRVEHLDPAFGISVAAPRLSWKLPGPAARQVAYRVRTDSWDSGRIESEQSVLVPYAGPALVSRQRVEWRVQVWTDLGISEWSEPLAWEMSLLRATDWSAHWIEPAERERGAAGFRPVYALRTTFDHDGSNARARLYATAHGIYELFLNGERVGDRELTPGYTSYNKRLQVDTFDVGELLQPGSNELRALLSDGWFRGQCGNTREHLLYGSTLALLAQLEADGTPIATTGAGWMSARSGSVADLMEGQRTDLRLTDADRDWSLVDVAEHGIANLCTSDAPPVRRVEIVHGRAVIALADGRQIVDLGQNINGWLHLANLGPRGTTLTLTHGESLDESGDVTMEHLQATHWQTQARLSAGQVDVIVSDGATSNFEPRHTTHGFRYVRVEGHPEQLDPDDVAGVVVHTDFRRTGWFQCSDSRLNRLHDAADWSFRTNACDIPTDCPQRERAGWTGDWQIFAPSAAFLYDVAGFTTKWLRDLAADQRADGAVRNFAPDIAPAGADEHPIKTFLEASSGWGDAAVLVPWEMWRSYGDERLLAEQWPSMRAWVEYEAKNARAHRHSSRVERSTEPATHEQYLWDTGFHWGEWCEPDRTADEHFANIGADFGIIATAYFAQSTATIAKVASVLGRTADADRYTELAANVAGAWCTEFLDADGNIQSDRQADHVRALAFDLVPSELRPQVADRLVKLIRDTGTHLNTGFLATPFLLPVLADAGHLDVAYELLFQESSPSWLAMIDKGATTIWENWTGVEDTHLTGSLNHYSKGAVISFLHEHVAGIRRLDDGPGYRRFHISPMPGGGLTSASAAHDSPYGRIESSWSIIGREFRLEVRVPPNTVAEVALPGGTRRRVAPGTFVFLGDAWTAR
jgi:alpha-L-rhamnosidase